MCTSFCLVLSVCLSLTVTATAKSLQLCPTLCDPIDSSPPGSPIPGILQARTLQWVAISFSNAWKRKAKVKSLSHAQLFATPWTAAHQAPPSTGFSRQEYWSGVPLPSPCTLLGVSNLSERRASTYEGPIVYSERQTWESKWSKGLDEWQYTHNFQIPNDTFKPCSQSLKNPAKPP